LIKVKLEESLEITHLVWNFHSLVLLTFWHIKFIILDDILTQDEFLEHFIELFSGVSINGSTDTPNSRVDKGIDKLDMPESQ
jgi:hypothetical protein